jgi:hypothetical protein
VAQGVWLWALRRDQLAIRAQGAVNEAGVDVVRVLVLLEYHARVFVREDV